MKIITLGRDTPNPRTDDEPSRVLSEADSDEIVSWHLEDRPYCMNSQLRMDTFIMGPPGLCCPECGWWASAISDYYV